jgi:hypothetical protein
MGDGPPCGGARFHSVRDPGSGSGSRQRQLGGSNGHPEPVLRDGRRLFFDEDELLSWGRAQLERRTNPPARITRDGRTLITRAELGRITGLSEQHLAGLYSQRAENGHPEAALRESQWLYFDELACREWHDRYRQAKVATLTEVDRSGDPDELVGIREAARLLGYAHKQSIDSYRARNIGYFPDLGVPEHQLDWEGRQRERLNQSLTTAAHPPTLSRIGRTNPRGGGLWAWISRS